MLALALQAPGSPVILDNNLARAVAKAHGLRLTRTAGGLLDTLVQPRFRLSDATREVAGRHCQAAAVARQEG